MTASRPTSGVRPVRGFGHARETIENVNPSARSELDALRYRAYGPTADIGDDPDALQRLADLERSTRRPPPESSSADAPVAASIPPSPSPSPTVTPDTPELVAPAPSGTEESPPASESDRPSDRPPRRRIRRLVWAAWGVSLVAVVAIAAFATYGLVSIAPVTVSHDARQIATLEPDATSTVPLGWFGAGASSASYTFYGLTLFETTAGMNGMGGDCFTVALSSDLPAEGDTFQNGYSASGPVYSACRVGNFPATLTFAVDSNSPSELRTQFPDAALQFVKDGDRIGVFRGSLGGTE